jgi:hypothetical protein
VTVHQLDSGSGEGQHTLNRWRPSPYLQEPERASNQHGRAQGIRPMRAFAFTDAVRPCFQRVIQAHPVAVQLGVRLTRANAPSP